MTENYVTKHYVTKSGKYTITVTGYLLRIRDLDGKTVGLTSCDDLDFFLENW